MTHSKKEPIAGSHESKGNTCHDRNYDRKQNKDMKTINMKQNPNSNPHYKDIDSIFTLFSHFLCCQKYHFIITKDNMPLTHD